MKSKVWCVGGLIWPQLMYGHYQLMNALYGLVLKKLSRSIFANSRVDCWITGLLGKSDFVIHKLLLVGHNLIFILF